MRAHWGEYLPGWHPWEDYRQGYSARPDLGGGVVLTLSHPLDYLRWLFGEVEALWAFTGKSSDLELQVEDTAEIGLRFANGVLGSLHLDYNQRPPGHWLEVITSQGTLRWDNLSGEVQVYRSETETGKFTRRQPDSSGTSSFWRKCDISCRWPGAKLSRCAAWQMAFKLCSLP